MNRAPLLTDADMARLFGVSAERIAAHKAKCADALRDMAAHAATLPPGRKYRGLTAKEWQRIADDYEVEP